MIVRWPARTRSQVPSRALASFAAPPTSTGGALLIESGDALEEESGAPVDLEGAGSAEASPVFLESGDALEEESGAPVDLEGPATAVTGPIDAEGGFSLEAEDGEDLLLEGTPITPVITPTLREALAAWLVGLSSLSGIGIYFAQPSQVSSYPCLVLKVTGRSYGHNLSGADGISRATVEITAMGLQKSQTIAIAEAVRNVAQGFRGLQSGVAILTMILSDESDDDTAPPDGSDQWIYLTTLEYSCKHRVPAPTSVTQSNA